MPDSPFLKHLIERLNRNRVIIFYGGMEEGGDVRQASLASQLVDECGGHCLFCREQAHCQRPASCVVSLLSASQTYQSYYGRQALVARVQNYYAGATQPTPVQRAIAALPVTTIITTAYDDGLAVALREAGRSVSLVARDTDIPFVDDAGRVQLIHLHGVLSQPDSLVLSEEAADDLFGKLPTLATILRGDSRKTLLFIGYPLSDRHFGALYRQATQPIARFAPRSYAVQWPVDETAARRWRENIEVITAEPLAFLNMLQDSLTTCMGSLTGKALEFYSCFISYSSKDQEFAERLHTDLQDRGVRCWFAPEDLTIGAETRQAIDQAIRKHDKLLLILSEHSVESDWVQKEVETAFEQERQRRKQGDKGATVLFPVRRDPAVMETEYAWAADIRRMRNIGDFTHWKEHDSYSKVFDRLLRDLKQSEKQNDT